MIVSAENGLQLISPPKKGADNAFFSALCLDGDFELFSGVPDCMSSRAHFKKFLEHKEYHYSIHNRDGKFIGFIGFDLHPNGLPEAAVSFYIVKGERRKGYCIEALNAAVKELSVLQKLWAVIVSGNIPARKLLEKLGFICASQRKNAVCVPQIDNTVEEYTPECVCYSKIIKEGL